MPFLQRSEATLIALLVGYSTCMWSQPRSTDSVRKTEQFRNAEITYDWVTNARGQKIRTFVTRPRSAAGKVPTIFFVGWLSCDSVEYPDGETDGFGAIFWRLIEQSGFATVRMDKPGVGESEGNCATTDFQTELDSYRAAFDSLPKYPFVDQNAIFVVGLSNGGGASPLAAFYQQLQELNLGKVWENVKVPVLVLHGSEDTVMSLSDSRAINDTVNRVHPEVASYIEIEDADHLLAVNKKLSDKVIPVMLGWIRKQLAQN